MVRASIIGFLVLLLPAVALAAAHCGSTPQLSASNYPGADKLIPGNDLSQPAGKAVASPGQVFVLTGRVVDRNCVPVGQATVELWQRDPFGQDASPTPAQLASPDPVFAGSGRSYTDADGVFHFITRFPGPVSGKAPRLNLRIKAQGMSPFTTALFFAGDERNARDAAYSKLSDNARRAVSIAMTAAPDGGLLGSVLLVLPGRAPYQTY